MGSKQIPYHVAIVMDGNGRWAKKRFLPRVAGHKAGIESVRAAVRFCSQQGVKILTLFAFSTENWQRPAKEVKYLMQLFLQALGKEIDELHKNGVQLRVIGDLSRLDEDLRHKIDVAEGVTRDNEGLKLIIALSYSGRWDITQGVRKICGQISSNALNVLDVSPELIGRTLCFNEFPDPDLFIRTSGEQRISNFMLWQLAYTELYFTEVLWPDFREQHFSLALEAYAQRKRKFGKIDEEFV